jgi:hypothetical protein
MATFDVSLTEPTRPVIDLDSDRRGEIAYAVKNKKDVWVRAMARVEPLEGTPPDWVKFSIESGQWDMQASVQSQVKILVEVEKPPEKTTKCSCRLTVANAASPQTDFTIGQVVTFTVPGVVPDPVPWRKYLIWCLIGAGACAAIAVVIIGLIKITGKSTVPELKGHSLSDARASLKSAGLKETDDIDLGTVADSVHLMVQDQDQPQGTSLPHGSSVKLIFLKSLELTRNGSVDFQKLANPGSALTSNDLTLEAPNTNAAIRLRPVGSAKLTVVPIAGVDQAGSTSVNIAFDSNGAAVPFNIIATNEFVAVAGLDALGLGKIPFVMKLDADGRLNPSVKKTGWAIGPGIAARSSVMTLNNSAYTVLGLNGGPAGLQVSLRRQVVTTSHGASGLVVWFPESNRAADYLDEQVNSPMFQAVTPEGEIVDVGYQDESGTHPSPADGMYSVRISPDTATGRYHFGPVNHSHDNFRPVTIAALPDGRILMIVSLVNSPLLKPICSMCIVGKDWKVDPAFGPVDIPLPNAQREPSFLISAYPDGKFLLAGTQQNTDGSTQVFLTHYSADGKQSANWTVPPPYQTGGTPASQTGSPALASMVARADGGAFLLWNGLNMPEKKLESDIVAYQSGGQLDTGFGTGGILKLPLQTGLGSAITVAPNGKLLLASISRFGCTVSRFNPNGAFDSDFGKPFTFADVMGGKDDIALSAAPVTLTGLPAKTWIYVTTNSSERVLLRVDEPFARDSASAKCSCLTWTN